MAARAEEIDVSRVSIAGLAMTGNTIETRQLSVLEEIEVNTRHINERMLN